MSVGCLIGDPTALPTPIPYKAGCSLYLGADPNTSISLEATKSGETYTTKYYLSNDCTGNALDETTFTKGKCQPDLLMTFGVFSDFIQPPVDSRANFAVKKEGENVEVYVLDKCQRSVDGTFFKLERFRKIVILKRGSSCDNLVEIEDQSELYNMRFFANFPENYFVKNIYSDTEKCTQTDEQQYLNYELISRKCVAVGEYFRKVTRIDDTYVFETFLTNDCSDSPINREIYEYGKCSNGVIFADAIFESAVDENASYASEIFDYEMHQMVYFEFGKYYIIMILPKFMKEAYVTIYIKQTTKNLREHLIIWLHYHHMILYEVFITYIQIVFLKMEMHIQNI
ncbi:hypothetical protein EIN_285320 [Entamoeba invadens IP1]|uniref:Uncharacterized protein n=1 Tax=Entamoeba invadens IP1 TaxID=370355 RepID=A0A0A1U8D4_ENTIV|nr:hypothetical protein EIN_285320 [Entamoeba invadens IP1]ELP89316.1 hypothetical protein EIN_285320 [Entamoeba invadens IP1]|eukprot:XP_004256087.1 hypothetical protein EIN_285320 [Entamoeba invadens IP1]